MLHMRGAGALFEPDDCMAWQRHRPMLSEGIQSGRSNWPGAQCLGASVKEGELIRFTTANRLERSAE